MGLLSSSSFKEATMKNAKIVFFMIFFISCAFIIIFFNFKKNITIQSVLENHSQNIKEQFDSKYKKYKQFSLHILQEYIQNDSEILRILYEVQSASTKQKDALRLNLYNHLKVKYTKLKNVLSIRQLHFHLPDNESFLRMHKPSKYGDNLTFIRESVAYVNKFKKPIDGFEEGRIFNGFRFVYPLFLGDIYLGSVEVSFSAYDMINDLIADYSFFANFIISNKVIEQKIFEDQKSNYIQSPIPEYSYDKEVLENLQVKFDVTQIAPNEMIKQLIADGIPKGRVFSIYNKDKEEIITVLPQENPINHNFVAAFIIKSKAHSIKDVISNFYFLVFFSTILLFLVILIFYIKQETDEKIKRQNERMKAIFNSQSIITILVENEEMKSVNSAFFDFFTTFQSLKDFKESHKNINDFFEDIEKEDYITKDLNDKHSWINKILQNPQTNYKVCMKKDTQLHHFAIKIEPIKSKSLKNSFVISLLDITKELSIHENLQNIINAQNNMLIILDSNLKLTYANNKFLDNFLVDNIQEFYTHFKSINETFLKTPQYFFSPNDSSWIEELSLIDSKERIVSIIDKNDNSIKAYLITPTYLKDSNTWICSFTEYTKLALEKQHLSKKAYIDELTQVANRAKFNLEIQKELDFFKQYESTFSLALFDIDFFKRINDTYGHSIGDIILQELALLVSENIRNTDILARWGGEEFVIIFHQTAIQPSFFIAEELRKKIQNHTFHKEIKLTCSFGLTHTKDTDDAQSLFKRVDKALYDAKQKGRNQVKVEG